MMSSACACSVCSDRRNSFSVSIRYDLKPLSPDETSAYVQHRLSVAGGGAAVSFAPKSLTRIHRHTAGIPRLINLLCDRALLSGYSAHTNRIVPDFVDSAAESLELQRPRRSVRGWVRQRFAAFAAGLAVAAVLTAGGATMWHYREYASRLIKARAAAEQVRTPDPQTPDQRVASHQ